MNAGPGKPDLMTSDHGIEFNWERSVLTVSAAHWRRGARKVSGRKFPFPRLLLLCVHRVRFRTALGGIRIPRLRKAGRAPVLSQQQLRRGVRSRGSRSGNGVGVYSPEPRWGHRLDGFVGRRP